MAALREAGGGGALWRRRAGRQLGSAGSAPGADPPAACAATSVRCSKQIHFGLMEPKEIVNSAELHVFERALYKARQGRAGREGRDGRAGGRARLRPTKIASLILLLSSYCPLRM